MGIRGDTNRAFEPVCDVHVAQQSGVPDTDRRVITRHSEIILCWVEGKCVTPGDMGIDSFDFFKAGPFQHRDNPIAASNVNPVSAARELVHFQVVESIRLGFRQVSTVAFLTVLDFEHVVFLVGDQHCFGVGPRDFQTCVVSCELDVRLVAAAHVVDEHGFVSGARGEQLGVHRVPCHTLDVPAMAPARRRLLFRQLVRREAVDVVDVRGRAVAGGSESRPIAIKLYPSHLACVRCAMLGPQ